MRKETILQFGEGGFLRGFFDWMLEKMHRAGVYDGQAVVVQPIREGKCRVLSEHGCRYTHIMRGSEGTEKTEISSISRAFSPYEDYDAYLKLSENPALSGILPRQLVFKRSGMRGSLAFRSDQRCLAERGFSETSGKNKAACFGRGGCSDCRDRRGRCKTNPGAFGAWRSGHQCEHSKCGSDSESAAWSSCGNKRTLSCRFCTAGLCRRNSKGNLRTDCTGCRRAGISGRSRTSP